MAEAAAAHSFKECAEMKIAVLVLTPQRVYMRSSWFHASTSKHLLLLSASTANFVGDSLIALTNRCHAPLPRLQKSPPALQDNEAMDSHLFP